MQQSQQILFSVKHKLPQPNSLLPSDFLRSQPAQHIRKRVFDILACSSCEWPLDQGLESNKQKIAAILTNYYGLTYDICELLKMQNKIVFLNALVNPNESQQQNYYFGSIQVNLKKPQKQITNVYCKQTTYQLEFDDKIQSGNLYFALQHEPRTYLLANRLDYNTRSYGQWFYFKVTNVTKKAGNFKFIIINMTKNYTMFGRGLKVSVCRKGVWGKQGTSIEYMANKFIRKSTQSNKNSQQTYYTLVFDLPIEAHQTIYVSYNEPYTYTKLGAKLDALNHQGAHVSRSILCRTPLGNRVQIITVSKRNNKKNKKIIFITARAHPIETAGSFVMDGILTQLSSPALPPYISQLLENYILKLVPMINPDGVIIGNSRCNLNGFDLNRQWKNPNKFEAPEVFNLKQKILSYEGRIAMFIDLHGHSKKKSVFAYGCHDIKNPISSREFPFLLSKFAQNNFVFSECRFSLLTQSKINGKDGTARVTLWSRLKIPNIFTIQNSYCCAEGSQYHYDSQSYNEIGKNIIQALCEYLNNEKPLQQIQYSSQSQIPQQLGSIEMAQNLIKSKILQQLQKNPQLMTNNIQDEFDASSQSEQQDRIVYKTNMQKDSEKKQYRSKSNKLYMNPKNQTRKQNTQNNMMDRKVRNATIEARNSTTKEDQLIHSTSNLELKLRRNLNRHLSPLNNKKQLVMTKCQGIQQIKQQKSCNPNKVVAFQVINKQKQNLMRPNNPISIIDIGIANKLTSAPEDHYLIKAFSAKTIKRQNGLNAKLNTIKPSNSQSIKLKSFLKSFMPTELHQYTDNSHPRHQPLLKSKRNVARNSSRLQDLVNKLNAMHVGMKNNRITSPGLNGSLESQ